MKKCFFNCLIQSKIKDMTHYGLGNVSIFANSLTFLYAVCLSPFFIILTYLLGL